MKRLSTSRKLLDRIGRFEPGVVLSLPVLTLGAWVFVEVLDEVTEGESQGADDAILLFFRSKTQKADPIGPAWVEEMARDLTALGGITALSLVTIATIGFLLLARKPRVAGFVTLSVLGAQLLSSALKYLIGRPRPELVPHLSHVFSASFPSGHSMLSTAVYLTLGALLARIQTSLAIKAYILGWALLLPALVGLSRVYVGVHWPTDVLAGWAAGAAWAALCWLLAHWLQRRGKLES
jgi:undecaprenyl-diphosphatase